MHTLVYAAHRSTIDELITVRTEFQKVYGPEFIHASEADPNNINEIIRENINLIMPEKGRKIARLMEIAREENIQYHPTQAGYTVPFTFSFNRTI